MINLTRTLAAGLLSAAFLQNGGAHAAPEGDAPAGALDASIIAACAAEAVDAVPVAQAQSYIDPGDGGIKKYASTDTGLAGVSAFPTQTGDGDAQIVFLAKYYQEHEAGFDDVIADMSVAFTAGGPSVDGYRVAIMDINQPEFTEAPITPAQAAVLDAVDTMALAFSACMGLTPYSRADGAAVTPPHFPALKP